MPRTRTWTRTFLMSLCIAGCGGPDGQMTDGAETASVAKTEQDIYLEVWSRPAGALVPRRVTGQLQLGVFACGTDHAMRRRIVDPPGTTPQPRSWNIVANSFPCDGPPSIGKWRGGTPHDTLGVYYRSTDNRLIEAWYSSDGSTQASDLTSHLDFPNITGNPTVVDAVDREGMSQRISVAVRRASDNEIFTFDYYQGSWKVRDTGRTGTGNTLGVSYGQYGKSYFSIQTAPTSYYVFARKSWLSPYALWAGVQNTDPPLFGVLNFANIAGGAFTIRTMNQQYGDFTQWYALSASDGGTFQVPGDEAATGVSDGNMFSAPTGPTELAYGRSKDGYLIQMLASSKQSWKTSRKDLLSAPVVVVDGEEVWSSAVIYPRYLSFANKIELFIAAPLPGTVPGPNQELWEQPLSYPGPGVYY